MFAPDFSDSQGFNNYMYLKNEQKSDTVSENEQKLDAVIKNVKKIRHCVQKHEKFQKGKEINGKIIALGIQLFPSANLCFVMHVCVELYHPQQRVVPADYTITSTLRLPESGPRSHLPQSAALKIQ